MLGGRGPTGSLRLAVLYLIIHGRSPSESCYHARVMKAIRKRRGSGTRTSTGVSIGVSVQLLGGALVGLLLLSGCAEGPRRAMEGARLYSAGTRSLEAGDTEAAVIELSRAADLVPHASEIQNHLGMAYWSSGDLDEAESAFDQALVLDCENEAARANRARFIAERLQIEGTVEGVEHGE